MAAKFTVSHRSGWLMAGPAIGLIFVYILPPFFFAFGSRFTNQRLISANPDTTLGSIIAMSIWQAVGSANHLSHPV